jgi:hypothetical protein
MLIENGSRFFAKQKSDLSISCLPIRPETSEQVSRKREKQKEARTENTCGRGRGRVKAEIKG